jgi:hypothetical protein
MSRSLLVGGLEPGKISRGRESTNGSIPIGGDVRLREGRQARVPTFRRILPESYPERGTATR